MDFIYVDSNTGQSSGGHSALRFDDTVIHFQYYPDGIFRIVREPYDRFSYSYNIYSNRTSKIARIKLEEQKFEKIRNGFDQVSVIQFKHLNNLDSLRKDIRFFSEISNPARQVRIRSLGYFRPGRISPWILKMREQIRTSSNPNRLTRLRSEIKKELESADAEMLFETFPHLPKIEKGKYPFYKGGVSSIFLPKLEKLAVLELLNGEYEISENSTFASASSQLQESEKIRIRNLQESLFRNTIILLEQDQDWGHTVLVNLARLFVLEKSLDTGRPHFLISFPENTETISGKTVLEDKASVEANSEILFAAAENFREELRTSSELSEDMYGIWEDLENRDWELRTGIQRGISIRNTFEKLSPDLSGEFLYSFPIPDKEKLSNLLAFAKKREDAYYSGLRAFYDFKLVRRNCTTEIFDVLDSSITKEEYEKALGSRIDPGNSLAFIPFLAYDSILEKWNPHTEEPEFSYRKAALSEMYKTENVLGAYLRESNTLSSSLYESNIEDPPFLLFTDDVVLVRPLYGIVNLGWGLGNAGLGVFTLPFDGGKRIKEGFQSAFFSLPELVFFNIRKGSFPKAKYRKRAPISKSKSDQ